MKKHPTPICPKCGSAAVERTTYKFRCTRCDTTGKGAMFLGHARRPYHGAPLTPVNEPILSDERVSPQALANLRKHFTRDTFDKDRD